MELVDTTVHPNNYMIRNSVSYNFISNYIFSAVEIKFSEAGIRHNFILINDIFLHQFYDLRDRFETGEVHSNVY